MVPSAPALPLWAGRSLALIGICLVAFNLRTAVTAISPIADSISQDIPLGNLELSLIGMVPPIAFALAGIFGASLARRLGLERFLVISIAVMTVGHLVRAIGGDFAAFFAGSVLALLGAGVGNVLLPPLVKRYFPDRIGLVTALYVTLVSVSTAAPAAAAAPIAHSMGWRYSLGLWMIVALISLPPWVGVLLARRRERSRLPDAAALPEVSALVGQIWHSPTAWVVAMAFSMSSFNAYSMFAWLPEILIETAGQSPFEAGAALSYYAALGIPFSLLAPIAGARMRNVGLLLQGGALFIALGAAGLLLAPAAAPWLWVTFSGIGQITFPVCLVLINIRSRTPIGSVSLSGFAQGLGYTVAASGPLLIGVFFEVTGSWVPAYLLLFASCVVFAVTGYLLRKPRYVEDDLQLRLTRLG